MTIAVEEQRIRSLFERVEEVEDVANSLPEGDQRRRRLLDVSNATLAEEATIRPVIAARLLGLSEKTIRAWAEQGVLIVSRRAPRLLLDVMSVHEVSHLLRELRAAGRDRDLLDEVWRRLNDDALADRDDFQESLWPDAPRARPGAAAPARVRRRRAMMPPDADQDQEFNIYAELYRLLGVEPPDAVERSKPPCCDEAKQLPPALGSQLDDIVVRAQQLRRTRRRS